MKAQSIAAAGVIVLAGVFATSALALPSVTWGLAGHSCGGTARGTAAGAATQPEPLASKRADAARLFEQLVTRYRTIKLYKDTARLVETTHRAGRDPDRLETHLSCEVSDGTLKVNTPGRQARQQLGVDLPVRTSEAMQQAAHDYDLWLAPHMTLKFTETPLRDFRAGIAEGFTPTDVETVVIDDKPMLHVELRSGDGLSESCEARFDLYVNQDSMLIERIDGEQRLPDGATHETSLHITPEPSTDQPPPGLEMGEPVTR